MPTTLTLITSALGKINMLGAGETVSAEDAALCMNELNTLVSAWENDGMFCYTTLDTTFTLPASTQSRTIGPSMQINIVRPVKVLRGSFGRVDSIDYPIVPIQEEDYNYLSDKTGVTSICPQYMYYDGQTPTGNVFFWPLAVNSVEVHLLTPEPSGEATSLATNFVFPPGYQRALEANLAIAIAPHFRAQPSTFLFGEAANSKRMLKRSYKKAPMMHFESVYTSGQSDINSGDAV